MQSKKQIIEILKELVIDVQSNPLYKEKRLDKFANRLEQQPEASERIVKISADIRHQMYYVEYAIGQGAMDISSLKHLWNELSDIATKLDKQSHHPQPISEERIGELAEAEHPHDSLARAFYINAFYAAIKELK